MAAELGMKQQQYARYEKGVTAPGIDVLFQICQVHACSADWLLGIDRGKSAAATVHGPGIAIANSPHAKASVTIGTVSTSSVCKSCKYLKAIKKLQKAGLKLPDDM